MSGSVFLQITGRRKWLNPGETSRTTSDPSNVLKKKRINVPYCSYFHIFIYIWCQGPLWHITVGKHWQQYWNLHKMGHLKQIRVQFFPRFPPGFGCPTKWYFGGIFLDGCSIKIALKCQIPKGYRQKISLQAFNRTTASLTPFYVPNTPYDCTFLDIKTWLWAAS